MRALDDIQTRFFLSLAGMWLLILLVLPFTKVSIDYGDFKEIIGLGLLIGLVGYGVGKLGMNLARGTFGIFSGLFIIMLPMIAANYVAMSFNMPLADELLAKLDASIGFDWGAFVAFVDASPWLARCSVYAYSSFLIQVALVPILLQMLGQNRRAYAFMTSYGLVCFLAAFIAIWFPAYGTYVHYGYGVGDLENIDLFFAYQFIEQFDAVRGQQVYRIASDSLAGILTFPSVHAAVAYLIIWATWSSKWLRYPFLALNLMMALSAVINANHYLVDIIASIPMAAVTVVLVRRIFAMNCPEPEPRPGFEDMVDPDTGQGLGLPDPG